MRSFRHPQWQKRQSSWYFDQPFGSFHSPTLHETFDGKLNSNRCIAESNAPPVIYFVAELTRGWRDAGIEDVGRGFSWSRWLNNQLHSSPSALPSLFFSKGKKFDRDSIWGRVDILMEIGIELSGRRRTVKYDMEFGYIFSLRESTMQPFSSLRYRAFPSIR